MVSSLKIPHIISMIPFLPRREKPMTFFDWNKIIYSLIFIKNMCYFPLYSLLSYYDVLYIYNFRKIFKKKTHFKHQQNYSNLYVPTRKVNSIVVITAKNIKKRVNGLQLSLYYQM